ncbi:glycosyltransferase family 32 protein [Mycena floridula]|nr:glycosyltransferase family 32 protein [Mycena floridula]
MDRASYAHSLQLPMYGLSQNSPRLRTPASTYFPPSSPRSRSPPKIDRYVPRPRPNILFNFLKIALSLTIIFIVVGLYFYEFHIEVSWYSRNWITNEIQTVQPVSDCFQPSMISPKYNMSEAIYGSRRTEVQAGFSLKMGLDCYDLAGTIRSEPRTESSPHIPGDLRTQYHTYWRQDLAAFGPRQDWMLKSFFATQNTKTSRLILWSNGDLSNNPLLQKYIRSHPDAFTLGIVDKESLARGTKLEGSAMLNLKDDRAWVDGDLIRLLVLWHYGGVWVDMDTLLTRDLDPLLEHEFVTQWDCYDKPYSPLNGALMRFRQHSPYLCEAFHIITTSPPPRRDSTDWGSVLYFKLWRRLVASRIPPFSVLPFCFNDARSCRLDNRLPDPFAPDNAKWTMGLGMQQGGRLDDVLHNIFAIHLHNQWEKEFPKNGWVQRLLLDRYEQRLAYIPRT